MYENDFIKYPRTQHIFSSKGTSDDKHLSYTESKAIIKYPGLVIEEKIDGTNTGLSFNNEQELILQCRGHIITSGMHQQYDLFKQWTSVKNYVLKEILTRKYVMYGEWLYACHTVFYDQLPHHFFEFDIWDKENNYFLDTDSRHKLLEGTGILSVPIVHRGIIKNEEQLKKLIPDISVYSTDQKAEGVYLKVEENGKTINRAKFVRPEFIQKIIDSNVHWQTKPIRPNKLKEGIDIYQ